MIFVVFSCDEPKGTENTESTQTGTTSDNNTNTDTDNTTTDNNTDTDNEDYITQNPYEELENTLTVKVNSIDVLDFADGEWEWYYCYFEDEGTNSIDLFIQKGTLTVGKSIIVKKCNYQCSSEKYPDSESYTEAKEYNADEEDVIFDDKNLIISYPKDISEEKAYAHEEFFANYEYFFDEGFTNETEDILEVEQYSVKTNSEKNAYSFLYEEEYYDKVDKEICEASEKYIFKKIK